jgi:nucleotide-binding universal stress UspA family protein
MSELENQRAGAEARRTYSARSDHPERDELMLRYLGAELHAARSGPSYRVESEPLAENRADEVAESSGPATIVVGVDGSDSARSAVRFALDEAVRREAQLRVVWAFPPPESWATAYGMPAPPPLDELTTDLEREGRKLVDEVVGEGDPAAADVPVTVQALLGSPGKVLVEQAQNADMLVIGHRGRGGFRSVVLGSVGLHCVLHATVPVTIVRPDETSTPAAEAESASSAQP